MGEVVAFPASRAVRDPLLSKRQLAVELGYSTRWIELRLREGMPVHRAGNGYARFRLSEVLAWMDERAGKATG